MVVQTRDLKNMSRFLTQVLGLKEGFRLPFPFYYSGVWLYRGSKPVIHIVEIVRQSESLSDIGLRGLEHFTFKGDDYSELLKRLKQQEIKNYEQTMSSINEHQVFVDGPDNLKIELLFNVDKSSINVCI